MTYLSLFSIWFLVSSLAEYLLALTPQTIPVFYKRGLYYLIVWPYVGVNKFKGWLGARSGRLSKLTNWFRN